MSTIYFCGIVKQDLRLEVPSEQYPTITCAISDARPGSLILVKAGVYREQLVLGTKQLTIEGVPNVKSDSGPATVFECNTGHSVRVFGSLSSKSLIEFRNIAIRCLASDSNETKYRHAIHVSKGGKVAFDNCHITSKADCGIGIGVHGTGSHVDLRSSSVSDCVGVGVYCSQQGSVEVSSGSKLINNRTGLLVRRNNSFAGIRDGCLIQFNQQAGIRIEDDAVAEISNGNEIVDNGTFGILQTSPQGSVKFTGPRDNRIERNKLANIEHLPSNATKLKELTQ